MKEQRKHQRIRFNTLPIVRIGQRGLAGTGQLESLSLGGLMLRTELPLRVGEAFGCEFAVFDSPLIDMPALAVNKLGNLYGARFQAGTVREWRVQQAINTAMASGKASILSINDLQGRKVMRIAGGLNAGLRSDFMHSLTKMGVDDLDLSGVTEIDSVGLDLCRIAVEQHSVDIVSSSSCVRTVMAGRSALGG